MAHVIIQTEQKKSDVQKKMYMSYDSKITSTISMFMKGSALRIQGANTTNIKK